MDKEREINFFFTFKVYNILFKWFYKENKLFFFTFKLYNMPLSDYSLKAFVYYFIKKTVIK